LKSHFRSYPRSVVNGIEKTNLMFFITAINAQVQIADFTVIAIRFEGFSTTSRRFFTFCTIFIFSVDFWMTYSKKLSIVAFRALNPWLFSMVVYHFCIQSSLNLVKFTRGIKSYIMIFCYFQKTISCQDVVVEKVVKFRIQNSFENLVLESQELRTIYIT
jgi:hypothetical protein